MVNNMTSIDENELREIIGGTKIPYIVKRGDTLSKLAERFHCTVEQACKWNKIEDPNKIDEGQKLFFPF